MKNYLHAVKGIDPVADAFAGTKYTDIIKMKNFQTACFLIHKGVGTTGTSTITIEACDDVSASNTTAIEFKYQAITTNDTHGPLTNATTAGFTTTAGSSQVYLVYVEAQAMAATGYTYVRLKAVEVADDPVLGGIVFLGLTPRYGKAIQPTAIV